MKHIINLIVLLDADDSEDLLTGYTISRLFPFMMINILKYLKLFNRMKKYCIHFKMYLTDVN